MMEFTKLNLRTWSLLGKRATFGTALTELAATHPNILALTADFTKSAGLAKFKQLYPDKFINVGIAEQNLIGIASGMASEGYNVFATSFASFIATRSYEQVKIHCGYMRENIKIIGLAAGFGVEHQGNTHYGLDDICLMRSIPSLTIISPADCTETVKAVEALCNFDGPAYLRLCGERGDPLVYTEDFDFEIGKGIVLREGQDVCIIATGTMVAQSIKAAKILEAHGIPSTVIDMHTIRPLDEDLILKYGEDVKLIATIEEAFITGGLGAGVSECMAEKEMNTPIVHIGVTDFPHPGSYKYMLEQNGLTPEQIADRILNKLKTDKN